MKSDPPTRFLIAMLVVCAWCVSCDSGGVALLNGGNAPGGSNSGGFVNDGIDGGGNLERPAPFDGALSARVRNESSSRVDVTMRFLRADDTMVHLAFVRVPTATVTTVASPEMADLVELSGIDETGRALDSAVFKYGVDFDERSPAEYIVVNRNAPDVSDDGATGALRLSLVEPNVDTTVTVGSALRVRWEDGGAGPAAMVRLFLQPEGSATASSLRVLSPAIGAAFDGINDEFALLIQDVSPGRYELVAQLADGDRTVQSIAPGRVVVRNGAGNKAPTISVTEPKLTVEVYADEFLNVSWTDEDSDDNAIITFTLEQPHTATASSGLFSISPPIAENPDGAGADSSALSLVGVLPGLYDLVATIDDGELMGVDRVEGAVRVLPSLTNDPPSLILLTPARDTQVLAGSTIEIRWTDGDANDDARISFLIDSNWSRVDLSGGERLLVNGISEDHSGAAGSATLTIPAALSAGKYRLIGVITDGMTQVITRAPGFLLVEGDPTVTIADGGNDTSGGGSDSGSGGGSGGSDNGGSGSDQDNVADGDGSGSGDGDHNSDLPDEVVVGDRTEVSDERAFNPAESDNGGGRSSDVVSGDDDGDAPNEDVVVIGRPDDVSGERISDPVGAPGERPSVVVVDEDDDPDGPGGPNVVVIGRPESVPGQRENEPLRNPVFNIGLVAQSPVIPAGITLTNVPYGGGLRVELDPPASWRPSGEDSLMQLRVPLSEIPNDAWPRTFDLIVVYLIDGAEQSFVWPRPVQIPQLVEVGYAGLSGGGCSPGGPQFRMGPQRAQGLAIGWYGGGITETSDRAQVEFWLSGDGLVPADGAEDSTHHMVFAGLGTPNAYSESFIDMATVILGGAAAQNHRDLDRAYAAQRETSRRSALSPGEYSLISVVDYGPYGRVVTRPNLDPVTVCPALIQTVLND